MPIGGRGLGAGEDHVVHALAAQALGDCSPITQRMASTTFDLPHPFGPTTAVIPSSEREDGPVYEGLEAVKLE